VAAGEVEEDIALAKASILAAHERYNEPDYTDPHAARPTGPPITDARGLHTQGHSMVTVDILTRMLARHEDDELAALQRKHVAHLVEDFWNPELGIQNEILNHDYARLPAAADHMFAGHSLETLWMLLAEALRLEDQQMFDEISGRIHRIVEMCWDYVFDGWADEDFFVFADDDHPRGPSYDMKTMWSHTELMIACMMVLAHTSADWARRWYGRSYAYLRAHMANTTTGVWRQAVDRRGNPRTRPGISPHRKGNYHQPRALMLNLLSLEQMINKE